MKTLIIVLGLASLLPLAAAVRAATGDITVRLVDMYDQPIPGASGGKAALMGLDDQGPFSLGPKFADASGVVVFTAQEIKAFSQGNLYFMIYTYGSNTNLQGKLYDPFGHQWTYLRYQATGLYDFTVPTPSVGSAAPIVAWKEMNLLLSFQVDWGLRKNRDFWFTRVVFHKPAMSMAHGGVDYGLNPIISDAWIKAKGLQLQDNIRSNEVTGEIRLTGTNLDQTLLARKYVSGPSTQYQVFLVNCLWGRQLTGIYDSEKKRYTLEFDPTSLFADTNAPAWDGIEMKKEVAYFAVLQAETWLPNSAGANNGVACAFGPPVAESLLYPIRVNIQDIRLQTLRAAKGDCAFKIFALPGNFRIEYSTDLKNSIGWKSLMITNIASMPSEWVDHRVPDSVRFYRMSRYTDPVRLEVDYGPQRERLITVLGSPGLTTIEYSTNLANPADWLLLMKTNIASTPFIYTDRSPTAPLRFYRASQP